MDTKQGPDDVMKRNVTDDEDDTEGQAFNRNTADDTVGPDGGAKRTVIDDEPAPDDAVRRT